MLFTEKYYDEFSRIIQTIEVIAGGRTLHSPSYKIYKLQCGIPYVK